MSEDIFEADTEAAEEFKRYLADPAARAAFVEAKQRYAAQGIGRSYRHVLHAVSETPWAIRPHMLGVIVDIIAFRAAGGVLSPEEIEARISGARRQVTPSDQGVAVIPIHGPIFPKASMFTEVSGATSLAEVRQGFLAAVASPEIKSIVLDIDSPGGQVAMVPEFATELRALRGRKPVVAVANTEAASAAYWLAAQADEIVVSPSGLVGSIGVVATHEEHSAEDEAAGVKTTLISAGKHKTEGNPYEPLSDDARDHVQSLVDSYYGMFTSDVAKGRGVAVETVRSGYGEGRVLGAKQALSEGLVDRIGTLDEVVSGLLRSDRAAGRVAAQVPLLEAPQTAEPFAGFDDVFQSSAADTPTGDEQPEITSEDVPEAEVKPLLREELRSRLDINRGKMRTA